MESIQTPQKKKAKLFCHFLVIFWSLSGQSPPESGWTGYSGHFLTWADYDQKMTGQQPDNDQTMTRQWPDSSHFHQTLVDFHWTSGVQLDNMGDCKLHQDMVRIFFKSLCLESIWTQVGVRLGETLTAIWWLSLAIVALAQVQTPSWGATWITWEYWKNLSAIASCRACKHMETCLMCSWCKGDWKSGLARTSRR